MTTVDEAVRALRMRRWMMLGGCAAGAILAAINARAVFSKAGPDWLDVGLVVVWGFVALSGAVAYVMLGRQIQRLEKQRDAAGPLSGPGPQV